jgi:hypothetical protein
MKVEPIGVLIIAACFIMIAVWPKYWYIGATIFAAFMIWLAYKTFK